MSYLQQEYEEVVLEVINEYLDKNRVFNTEKIIPYINSRLRQKAINLNDNGIKNILERLARKKLIVEGSTLKKGEILLNDKRRKIYDYVQQKPAVYYNKIRKTLGFPHNVVVWHLEILEQFEYIQSETFEGVEVYFDSRETFERIKYNYFFINSKSQQIIAHLEKNDSGSSKSQLASALNIHPQTVSKYLKLLVKYNIAEKEEFSRNTLYFLTPEYYEFTPTIKAQK